jgi:hypothetical protein
MQFASALVEYLAAGVAALLWLRPLAQRVLGYEIPINEDSVVLALPMAYVLGIYIDSSSSFLIRFLRLRKIRPPRFLQPTIVRILGNPYSGTYDRTVSILSRSPELLAQTMLTYVGRDRIARCMALNSFLGILTVLFIDPGNRALLAILVLSFLLSLATWHRLKRLSSKFKDQALKTLLHERCSSPS